MPVRLQRELVYRERAAHVHRDRRRQRRGRRADRVGRVAQAEHRRVARVVPGAAFGHGGVAIGDVRLGAERDGIRRQWDVAEGRAVQRELGHRIVAVAGHCPHPHVARRKAGGRGRRIDRARVQAVGVDRRELAVGVPRVAVGRVVELEDVPVRLDDREAVAAAGDAADVLHRAEIDADRMGGTDVGQDHRVLVVPCRVVRHVAAGVRELRGQRAHGRLARRDETATRVVQAHFRDRVVAVARIGGHPDVAGVERRVVGGRADGRDAARLQTVVADRGEEAVLGPRAAVGRVVQNVLVLVSLHHWSRLAVEAVAADGHRGPEVDGDPVVRAGERNQHGIGGVVPRRALGPKHVVGHEPRVGPARAVQRHRLQIEEGGAEALDLQPELAEALVVVGVEVRGDLVAIGEALAEAELEPRAAAVDELSARPERWIVAGGERVDLAHLVRVGVVQRTDEVGEKGVRQLRSGRGGGGALQVLPERAGGRDERREGERNDQACNAAGFQCAWHDLPPGATGGIAPRPYRGTGSMMGATVPREWFRPWLRP